MTSMVRRQRRRQRARNEAAPLSRGTKWRIGLLLVWAIVSIVATEECLGHLGREARERARVRQAEKPAARGPSAQSPESVPSRSHAAPAAAPRRPAP